MNGWMDECMKWLNENKNEGMNEWVDEWHEWNEMTWNDMTWMNAWNEWNAWMNDIWVKWMNERMIEHKRNGMHEWNEWMDEWMNDCMTWTNACMSGWLIQWMHDMHTLRTSTNASEETGAEYRIQSPAIPAAALVSGIGGDWPTSPGSAIFPPLRRSQLSVWSRSSPIVTCFPADPFTHKARPTGP